MPKGILKINFIAGTHITTALKEAKKESSHFRYVLYWFNFNGIKFSIWQTADLEKALIEYYTEILSETPDSIVCA